MEPEDKPPTSAPQPINGEKTTAPREMPGFTARQAADLGIWSDGHPPHTIRRKYAYSIT